MRMLDGGAFCWTATEREGSEVFVVLLLHYDAENDNEGGS